MDKLKDFKIPSHSGVQENLAGQTLWMLKMQIAVLIKDNNSFQIVTIHHGNLHLWTYLL